MRLCLDKTLESREFYSLQRGVLRLREVPVERCFRKNIDKIIHRELFNCQDYNRFVKDRECLLSKIHSLSQKELNFFCFCFRTNSELVNYLQKNDRKLISP